MSERGRPLTSAAFIGLPPTSTPSVVQVATERDSTGFFVPMNGATNARARARGSAGAVQL